MQGFKKAVPVIILVVAVLYGVSPVDLIPDVVPVVGLADDAALIIAAITVVIKMLTGARQPRNIED